MAMPIPAAVLSWFWFSHRSSTTISVPCSTCLWLLTLPVTVMVSLFFTFAGRLTHIRLMRKTDTAEPATAQQEGLGNE